MQGDDGHDEYSEAEEEGVYSEELSGSEAAGGRRAEVAAAVAASEGATSATTTRRSRWGRRGGGRTRSLLRSCRQTEWFVFHRPPLGQTTNQPGRRRE